MEFVPLTTGNRKGAQDWGEFGQLSLTNPHSFLENLAAELNTRADEAWQRAGEILAERNLSRAVGLFNEFAEAVTFRLKMSEWAENVRLSLVKGKGVRRLSGRREPVADIVGPRTQHGKAVRYLWEYFRLPDRRRLKRCAEEACGKWFVDYTRPGNGRRCSKECTWRWWNRNRRQEAGHESQRRGRQR